MFRFEQLVFQRLVNRTIQDRHETWWLKSAISFTDKTSLFTEIRTTLTYYSFLTTHPDISFDLRNYSNTQN